ncbi:MAG: hypothetical protein KGL39_08125 [Patescibacteria group bacterium]|nr:hypothetical protein [Patescibacteria group bacterium]
MLARCDPLPSIEQLPDDYRDGPSNAWWIAANYLELTGWCYDEENWTEDQEEKRAAGCRLPRCNPAPGPRPGRARLAGAKN